MNAKIAPALILLVASSIVELPAHAATVISSNDQASEILGLQIGSGDYNVTFSNGITGDFASTYPGGLPTLPATPLIIINDIAAVLNAANVHYAGPAGYGIDEFGVPVSASGGNFYYVRGFQVNNGAASGSASDWIYNDDYGNSFGPYSVNETEITSFAVLTPASPVPLPAAAWLLVSGIGGIGAFARKSRVKGTPNSALAA